MLADCHWYDSEEVLKMIDFCFNQNKTLARYDFKFNMFSTIGIEFLIKEVIPNSTHVQDVEISTVLSEELRD